MYQRMFPDLKVDVENELNRYKKYAEKVRPLVHETVSYLDRAIRAGKKVLVEGANAAMLDIDFGKFCPLLIINNLSFILNIYYHRTLDSASQNLYFRILSRSIFY